MSKIHDLIAQYCPDGVEYSELGVVLSRSKGTKITAAQMKELHNTNGDIKVFAGGKTFAMIMSDNIPSKDINYNPSIIVKSRGVIEFEFYDKPFTHKNEFWSYYSENENILIKYVYYYLKLNEAYFQQLASKMQMPQISLPDTQKYKIPIPPLLVQEEIVNVLDKFTELVAELVAELEAELEARTRQYKYYRNQLLSFEGKEVEWKALEEVAKIKRGVRVVKSQLLESGDIPVYQNSLKPLGYFEQSNVKADTAYIISAGAAGDVGYSNVDFWAADDCLVCYSSELIVSKYLYHILINNQQYLYSRVRRASIPRLSREVIDKIKIPVPSLDEQERIVAILDKLDALVNDISVDLPAEIQARKQQYEYYRGTLLTFDSLVNADLIK